MAVKYLMGKKVIESNVIQWKEILIVSSLHYITFYQTLPKDIRCSMAKISLKRTQRSAAANLMFA
jgi:hypothetical protein